jgi:4a-hydroxytetrahydrobiopterin dehydratase
MSESELLSKHPVELPAGTPTLDAATVERLMAAVPGWSLEDGGKTLRLKRRFDGGFLEAVAFLDKVAPLAEEEDHHPDVRIYSYRWLDLDFSTHSIGGLSENDFIMAAKVNRLMREQS